MSNNVTARIPVRAENEITKANAPSAPAIASAEIRVAMPHASPAPMSASSRLILDRRALALALRFASRVASRAPIPALTRHRMGRARRIDLRTHLHRISGVDFTSITGYQS